MRTNRLHESLNKVEKRWNQKDTSLEIEKRNTNLSTGTKEIQLECKCPTRFYKFQLTNKYQEQPTPRFSASATKIAVYQ